MQNSNKKFNILIGIPVATHIENECIEGIFNAVVCFNNPLIDKVSLFIKKGYMVDDNRNAIALEAIKRNCDYVLMVDSDTVIPPNTLSALLEAIQIDPKIKMACGWQRRKFSSKETETFIEDGQKDYILRMSIDDVLMFAKDNSIFEIKGSGFGAVLIAIDVIKEMLDKKMVPFKYVVYDPLLPASRLSEDNYFCNNLKRLLGYKIVCVPAIYCGHIWKEVH